MAKKSTTGIFGLCFVKRGWGGREWWLAVLSWLFLATILCPKQDLHAWEKVTLSKAYFAPKQDYIWALIARQHPLMPYQSYNHGQKCWDTFWAVFQFTQVQLLPSPHKQRWTRVSRIFSEFQLCIGWGEGELQENFENDALF